MRENLTFDERMERSYNAQLLFCACFGLLYLIAGIWLIFMAGLDRYYIWVGPLLVGILLIVGSILALKRILLGGILLIISSIPSPITLFSAIVVFRVINKPAEKPTYNPNLDSDVQNRLLNSENAIYKQGGGTIASHHSSDKCTNCGLKVSFNSERCPHCGVPR